MAQLIAETPLPLLQRAASYHLSRMMPHDALTALCDAMGERAAPLATRKMRILSTLVAAEREGRLRERDECYRCVRQDRF